MLERLTDCAARNFLCQGHPLPVQLHRLIIEAQIVVTRSQNQRHPKFGRGAPCKLSATLCAPISKSWRAVVSRAFTGSGCSRLLARKMSSVKDWTAADVRASLRAMRACHNAALKPRGERNEDRRGG